MGQTILNPEVCPPPRLPSKFAKNADAKRWWTTWTKSPQAALLGSTDWQVLLDTLPLVVAYYGGELRHGAEIRQRMSKFGATPEDRARLRIQFGQADEIDRKRPAAKPKDQDRFSKLAVLPTADDVAS